MNKSISKKKVSTPVKKGVKKNSKSSGKRLVLRNCNPDGSSQNWFVWNTQIGAINTCPDWIDNYECGNGLHGWLDGIGDTSVSNYNFSSLWLVLEVEKFNLLDGKVKFESCVVVYKGSKSECAKYLYDAGIRGAIIGLTGDYPEGGDYSALISEDSRTQTAGSRSTQTAGWKSTQTAGHYSTQTAGDYSTQTAGHYSTQTAGDYSTQTAGHYSNITCGNNCKVTAGLHSVVIHRFWNDKNEYKTAVYLIREDKANKTFKYLNGQQIETK